MSEKKQRLVRQEAVKSAKYLKYDPEFVDGTGNPISLPDRDQAKIKEAREAAKAAGKDTFDLPVIERVTFAQVVIFLVNQVSDVVREKDQHVTLEDTMYALDVLRAFAHPTKDGYIEIPEKAYDWLISFTTVYGTKVFKGVVPALLMERFRDLYVTVAGDEEKSKNGASSIKALEKVR